MAEKKKRNRVRGEGSVYERSGGGWEAKYQNVKYNGGKPVIRRAKTEREAYQKLEEIKEQLFGGQLADGTTTDTVEEYIKRWLYTYKKYTKIKAQSFDRVESTVNTYVIPEFGTYLMSSLNTDEIQIYLNKLSDSGKSYSTIKKIYDALNDCCRWAVDKNELKRNPIIGVALSEQSKANRKKKHKEVRYFTREEEKKLLQIATSKYTTGKPRYRLGWAVLLVLNTGIRVGELASLKWDEHIDFDKKTITIEQTQVSVKDRTPGATKKRVLVDQDETKSISGQRTLKINKGARVALRKLHRVTGKGKYVVSTLDGQKISIIQLDRMMDRMYGRAGFTNCDNIGMHALRHTFASKLFAKGENAKVVSAILGHSSVKITYDTYIHLIQEQQDTAIDILDDM